MGVSKQGVLIVPAWSIGPLSIESSIRRTPKKMR